jgi:hypothetical protein
MTIEDFYWFMRFYTDMLCIMIVVGCLFPFLYWSYQVTTTQVNYTYDYYIMHISLLLIIWDLCFIL